MIISIYNIVIWFIDSKKTGKTIEEISETVNVKDEKDSTYEIDFSALKEKNSDVVAWLKVNGTNIEYPVVKAKDNYYYLKHSLDKTKNKSGWIFADFKNKFDGTDRNIIIYGHNVKDGSMFNTLKNVIKPDWYKNVNNHKIIFITEEGNFEYQVFSVYKIGAQDYDTTINFTSDKEFLSYIQASKKNSLYNFNVDISSEDKILTLSTCTDDGNHRIVLQAKKIL